MYLKTLAFLLCLAPLAAHADIYKWVDEDGTVVYSDEPREGAERIESAEPESSFEFRVPERPSRAAAGDADEDEQEAYEAVRIVAPAHEGTVRDNQGLVDVRVGVDPELRPGHYLQVMLDGAPRGEPTRSTAVRLENVHRGEHRVSARIVDGDRNTVAESEPVTFYMHQASRLIPGGQQGPPGGGAQNPGGVAFPGN